MTLRNIGLVKPSARELEEHLKELFPQKSSDFLEIIGRMEQVVTKLIVKLDVDSSGKPYWAASSPERANWEWRRVKRSFGRRERQQLVDELQYWNTSLKNVFEKAEVVSDESDPLVEEIQARSNPKHCDTVRRNARIFHDALAKSWECTCKEGHDGRLQLNWHDEKVPTSDSFGLLLPTSGPHSRWCHISVKMEETSQKSAAGWKEEWKDNLRSLDLELLNLTLNGKSGKPEAFASCLDSEDCKRVLTTRDSYSSSKP
ncbi:Uu.00g070870.m01.CDS01 [Anthostomella pinea]|uniref:Uu.00g070870.m01.CDS01 n=1 Tax=Anthostomella pinea TaxID=933095 RepID=A0AAI8YLA8_9PEZI|nr:Uu.00g070870.m01.CDS01 [Anthostomella pinea]